MSKGIHLIMPMGGKGSRFFENGYVVPKPLIEINERPFFYWATQSIRKFVELKSLTFVVLQEHIYEFDICNKISAYFPEASFVVLQEVLNGAVLTCLEGVKLIEDDEPIIFNDCDHLFHCTQFYSYCEVNDFSAVDGALLTFSADDPKYSYVEYNAEGNIIRTIEKVVTSNDAICGAYYFKNRVTFELVVEKYLDVCAYKEYFVSGVYNIMAEKGQVLRGFSVDSHLSFGTPDEYHAAINSRGFEELI